MKTFIPLLALISVPALAVELPIKVGGFLDSYYAFDANSPKPREREFTTQPVRHNEFNINLAYIDAVVTHETTRGRLALQYGNSVTKNYSSEPNDGATSGARDAQIFQEAYLGKRVTEKTWIDAGIFLGNIGGESWISKDNWTYSRALNADYTPYYASGVRLEHFFSAETSFQFQVINGWQNISENNNGKAIAMQYKDLLTKDLTFIYNNFFGDEEVVPNPVDGKFKPRFRGYHNFVMKWMKSDRWQFLGSFDVGHQSQQNNDGVDLWAVSAVTIRRVLTVDKAVALRLEHLSDPHEANISTSTPNGFQVSGASFNYDQNLDQNVLWRTEIRGFYSEDEIYKQGSNGKNRLDGFLVTSLSAWI